MSNLINFAFLFSTLFVLTHAAHFDVLNNCPFTVWGAWASRTPGGGMQLAQGQTWSFDVAPGTVQARIWARTNCNFDANGQGRCETGNCPGGLVCTAYGEPPNTLAEFALNQPNNLDFVDISLVDGFNVAMDFSPATPGVCRDLRCTANINGECPAELKAQGGCNNPCTVYKTQQYCCTQGPCGPTPLSMFFKQRCPDAYSYPQDDPTSLFTCPAGTNYKVTFCPA